MQPSQPTPSLPPRPRDESGGPEPLVPETQQPTPNQAPAPEEPAGEPALVTPAESEHTPLANIPTAPHSLAASSDIPIAPALPTEHEPLPTGQTPSPWSAADAAPASSTPQPAFALPLAQPARRNHKKAWLLGGLASVVLLAGGSAGYVYGYYLPSLPENVWKTSLERSGTMLAATTDDITDTASLKSFEKSEISASFTSKDQHDSASGKLTARFDPTHATADASVKYQGQDSPERNVSLRFIGELAAGSQYPTAYLQVSGLAGLGLEGSYPRIVAYDGKWIKFDEAYLRELGVKPTTEQEQKDTQVTSSDIAALLRDLARVTSERLFSIDPAKGVLEQKAIIGPEEVDGLSTYKYSVVINKTNAASYCRALADVAMKSTVMAKIEPDETQRKQTADDEAKSCSEDLGTTTPDENTIELWVDRRYKLVHKLRLTQKDNTASYDEFGQTYTGGSTIKLFSRSHYYHKNECDYCAEEGITPDPPTTDASSLTIEINPAASTTSWRGEGSSGASKDDRSTYSFTLDTKPYQGNIDTTAPASSVPISDFLKDNGLDYRAQTTDDSNLSAETRVQGARDNRSQPARSLQWISRLPGDAQKVRDSLSLGN